MSDAVSNSMRVSDSERVAIYWKTKIDSLNIEDVTCKIVWEFYHPLLITIGKSHEQSTLRLVPYVDDTLITCVYKHLQNGGV